MSEPTLRERLQAIVDYPTTDSFGEFRPRTLPETVWELARGFQFETALDPARCTPDVFEQVKKSFATIGVVEEVRELLPELRLAHVALVIADLHVECALPWERGENTYGPHVFATFEEHASAVQHAAERAVREREEAARYYAAAERTLGLDDAVMGRR